MTGPPIPDAPGLPPIELCQCDCGCAGKKDCPLEVDHIEGCQECHCIQNGCPCAWEGGYTEAEALTVFARERDRLVEEG